MGVSSVLVAVTGEQYDEEVVKLACELLNSNKGHLYIMYTIEVERGLPVDAEIPSDTSKGEEVLKHLESVAKPYKCVKEAELVQARITGSAVVQEARTRNVDTIVLGIPYRSKKGSYCLGETVPYVLKNAPCRVVVWRDPEKPIGSNDGAS